jgi:hypothetical protein
MAINMLHGYIMDFIEIKTLVDITNTRVTRPNQGTQLEYDQSRNFATLLQCVELRSIISYDTPPSVEVVDVKNLTFGNMYTGNHKVWTFTFATDRAGVYFDDRAGVTGLLNNDIDGVPIIKNLTETINMIKAIFNCKDPFSKNTIITAHPGTT